MKAKAKAPTAPDDPIVWTVRVKNPKTGSLYMPYAWTHQLAAAGLISILSRDGVYEVIELHAPASIPDTRAWALQTYQRMTADGLNVWIAAIPLSEMRGQL